ncbi:MAG: DUF3127 domain-containing protein [Prevotella sp.]
MQITGKITRVLPAKTGTTKKGGTWTAQQYVLEAGDDAKTAVLLEVFGQKEIDQYAIAEGETLSVTFTPKVTEYGDRVFGRNSVTGVERPQPEGQTD